MAFDPATDERYLAILTRAIDVSKRYRPRFGGGKDKGYTLEEFLELYGNDPFYTWMGFNTPLLYSAHKAAGGMTSMYRQVGIGCQQLFVRILQDNLALSDTDVKWSYTVPREGGKERTLSLDAHIPLQSVQDTARRNRIREWMDAASRNLSIDSRISAALEGIVFEVRQGYKSKDSKRQNADIANAAHAYSSARLPVALLLSNQIDSDIATRYSEENWHILRGITAGSNLRSTYSFAREIVGYDLAAFFERNSPVLKAKVEEALKVLLAP